MPALDDGLLDLRLGLADGCERLLGCCVDESVVIVIQAVRPSIAGSIVWGVVRCFNLRRRRMSHYVRRTQ